jgi:hypothetical protein
MSVRAEVAVTALIIRKGAAALIFSVVQGSKLAQALIHLRLFWFLSRLQFSPSYSRFMATNAQERLLKAAGPNYGTSTTSNAYLANQNTSSVPNPSPSVENGLTRHRTIHDLMHASPDEKSMRLKQVIASFAIVLSAGGKLAHEFLRAWRMCLVFSTSLLPVPFCAERP